MVAMSYIGIANRSPCVVPSLENITSPSMNNSVGTLYVLISRVEMEGQRNLMLCRAASRFSEFKALLASTSRAASVSSCRKNCCTTWTAASTPAICPAQHKAEQSQRYPGHHPVSQ